MSIHRIGLIRTAGLTAAAFVAAYGLSAQAGGVVEPISEPAATPCLKYGDMPQVTLGIFGGSTEDLGFGGLSATIFVPGANHDFQIDADLGQSDNGAFGQLAGHMALWDLTNGRAGLYAGWSGTEGGNDLWRLGAEVEKSFASGRLAAVAGWQDEGDSHLFVESRLEFDVTEATRLSVGYGYDDDSSARLRVEHDFGGGATTAYLEGRLIEGGESALLAGLNMQIGHRNAPACPEDVAQARKGFTHWSMPKLVGSTPVSTAPVTRACTVDDLRPGAIPEGCTGTASGVVVDGDTSGCGVASMQCS